MTFPIMFIGMLFPCSGQDYIDRTFGNNGSTQLIYTISSGSHPSVSFDSLDNIYISFTSNSSAQKALVKVNPNGIRDSTFGVNGVMDSLSRVHFQKDNFIISYRSGSDNTPSIIQPHDLEMNRLDSFAVPGIVDLKNFRYDSSGYLIASIRGGTMFKYINGNELDTTFANKGILKYENISGLENSSIYIDGYRSTNFDENHIMRVEFYNSVNNRNAMAVILDKFGNLIRTIRIEDISDFHINLDEQYFINEHLFITGYRNLTDYITKVKLDGQVVDDFGAKGTIEYANTSNDVDIDELFIGEFSDGQLLTATRDFYIHNIFLMDQEGQYNTNYGDNGYINLIDPLNVVREVILHKDEIYVVHRDSFTRSNFYITKLKLDNTNSTANSGLSKNSELKISPNPTSDIVRINYNEFILSNANILIHDIEGRFIQSKKINLGDKKFIDIDVSNLLSGIYIISLTSKGIPVSSQKLIVLK